MFFQDCNGTLGGDTDGKPVHDDRVGLVGGGDEQVLVKVVDPGVKVLAEDLVTFCGN